MFIEFSPAISVQCSRDETTLALTAMTPSWLPKDASNERKLGVYYQPKILSELAIHDPRFLDSVDIEEWIDAN